MCDTAHQRLGLNFRPLFRWKNIFMDVLIFGDCIVDLINNQRLVFPRDRSFSARIRQDVESSLQSNNVNHKVCIFVENWGVTSSPHDASDPEEFGSWSFGAVELVWQGLPPDKNDEFLCFRRAFYNIATAAYPPREMPPDDHSYDFSSPVAHGVNCFPSPHYLDNAEMFRRSDSYSRRRSSVSKRASEDEQANPSPVANPLHHELELTHDALLLRDVLHDLERICAAVFPNDPAADSPSDGDVCAQILTSNPSKRYATHVLGRLIDLLQSLWTLTNPDVCETLEELDDRITQVLYLFESEILPIYSATRSVLMRGPDVPCQAFEKLVFLPSQIPHQSQTCDNLLHRIVDLFGLPQSQQEEQFPTNSSLFHTHTLHLAQPVATLQVGALARVVRSGSSQNTFLKFEPSEVHLAHLQSDWEALLNQFEIFPSMEVRVLRLNAPGERNHAFVRVPDDQKGFPQCKNQEGFVESKHLVAVPALPLCNSASICLMRCVHRVALRELVLGFVDYTSSEATNWDNSRLDVVRAFGRFAAASDPKDAESFLRQHVFSQHYLKKPDAVDRVIFSMLRYLNCPELAAKVQDLISVAYPVELGIRLRALVYPVQKLYDDEFVIEPDARAALEEFVLTFAVLSHHVKSPEAFMSWYLKSRIFLESVINLSVCEADKFIDHEIETLVEGNRSTTIFQILDEQASKTFSSFERLMLDFLQPSSVQLLANLNECLRKYFEPSNATVAALAAAETASCAIEQLTVLRSSQSSYDSVEDDSPRMAPRMAVSPRESINDTASAVDAEITTRTLSFSASPQLPLCIPMDLGVPAPDVPNSVSNIQSTALSLILYTAVVCHRNWWKPSIVPHRLTIQRDSISDVLGILRVDQGHEYLFCPSIVLPVMRSGSEVSFPKVSLQLTDQKGKELDARELDKHIMFLTKSSMPSSSAVVKPSFKNSAYRNAGYSIRVLQYFLEVEYDALARDCLWWYMSDTGSELSPYAPQLSLKIEAEWGKFRANGASATFMLRDEPEIRWQINFFLMIQKNIETSSSRIIVRIDNITSTQLKSQLSAAVAPQRAHDAARGGDI